MKNKTCFNAFMVWHQATILLYKRALCSACIVIFSANSKSKMCIEKVLSMKNYCQYWVIVGEKSMEINGLLVNK